MKWIIPFYFSNHTVNRITRFFFDFKTSPIFSLNKIFPKVKKILLLKKQTFQKENISRNSSTVFFQSKILFRLKKAAQNISQNLRPYSPNIPEIFREAWFCRYYIWNTLDTVLYLFWDSVQGFSKKNAFPKWMFNWVFLNWHIDKNLWEIKPIQA